MYEVLLTRTLFFLSFSFQQLKKGFANFLGTLHRKGILICCWCYYYVYNTQVQLKEKEKELEECEEAGEQTIAVLRDRVERLRQSLEAERERTAAAQVGTVTKNTKERPLLR